ncbi:zinc finger, C2H2 type [Necator americanus]|uniref:Zinc finger, C2H2 type n=1 Tax=Necator americanus TaxID=51031 RepID=W2SRA2_NECAM|nr:zinc finger, C2H2 type [Necator americanus]ETN71376.1 zinc finger, C2H2 type [Necator americanus]
MDELNACTECGFTTPSMETIEWTESDSPTPSPNSVPEKNSPATVNDDNPSFEGLRGTVVVLNVLTYSLPETSVIQELPAVGPKTSKTAHVCPHCNFTTYMSQHMKSHLDAHERHQGQMYQCDICQMQFSQKANMHRHRMRHSGVKPYECRYCKKRFFRKDQTCKVAVSLERRLRKKGLDDEIHSLRQAMQEHSMTHIKTGVDFDCPVAFCTHQFSQHSTLRSHLDEAHNVCASSPASCKRCSLLFANSRRLLLHYQTRHDDSECGGVHSKKENDISLKKRRPLSTSASPSQIRPVCKKDFSPHQTDSSEISSSPDWDQVLVAANQPTYPMTSEDLLIMCLNPALKLPATSHAAKFSIEQTMRLWAADPAVHCDSHSPSATSGASQSTEVEKIKETMECAHCGISFFDETMHLLHKGLHTEGDPWRCNLCGTQCMEKYMFTTHPLFLFL